MIANVALLLLHSLAGLALTREAASTPHRSLPLLFCLCLLVSQASLLGMWLAAKVPKTQWQSAIVLAAAVALTVEIHFAAKVSTRVSIVLILAPLIFPPASLLAARRYVSLERSAADAGSHVGRTQFSIAQLLILTAVVAVLVTLGQWLVGLERARSIGPMIRLNIDDYLLDMMCFSFCAMPVGMVGLWSVLGVNWPWPRCLAMLLVPLIVGMLPKIFRGGPENLIFVLASFVIEMIVAGTLVVARVRNFRLIWIAGGGCGGGLPMPR